MNPKHTYIWAAIAVFLFAFIFFFERHWQKPLPLPQTVLPNLKAAAVTRVIVQHAGQPEIRAERTNGSWIVIRSSALPAQSGDIEELLGAIEKLIPAKRIPARELRERPRAEEEFGVDNPQTTLVLLEGEHRNQINIGALTAPGDQVFVQVVGQEGIYVVGANLLKLLPESAGDWRDTTFLDWRKLAFNELVVSNASGAMRFQRDLTNGTWRIREPLKTGADDNRIEDALGKLRALRISRFVTDEPRGELEGFGLQPPAIELTFRSGTNLAAQLRFGKNTTNNPAEIFAQRDQSVVTLPSDLLAPWRQNLNYFRDRRLFAVPAEFSEVEVRGEESFTLQRGGSNSWRVAGENFPVDAGLVGNFLSALGEIQIVSFVKDVAISSDFAQYGLTSAVRQIVFKLPVPAGTTNAPTRQVSFSAPMDGTNYARRSDEDSVFAVRRADVQQLPTAGWQLRDRRVWSFSTNDVARILARQDGHTREFIRTGTNSWAMGAGTQGVTDVDNLNLIVQLLSELKATAWAARGEASRNVRLGFATNNLALTIELKSGPRLDLQFGGVSSAGYPYALVTLDGEPWVFEFSTALYQFMFANLANPNP